MDSNLTLAPEFIRFLFSKKPKFDCYFRVGNENHGGNSERIGAVKLMLMAHSEVFRLELEDSELKEKNDVPIKDIHPETFKGMLKYVYGHDTTSVMGFDEADNLLYVAEKYMMKPLKDKLAVRLMNLLNPDNICSLLNNPACYTHLELNAAITEILRQETDNILTSPLFLCMNADGFLKILEQDGLAVSEIELWRAAIQWAKHRADSEEGQVLRQQLSGLTQHLRPLALTSDDVFEVIPSDVLTKDEIKTVCLYHRTKDTPPQDLIDFSSETKPRKKLQKKTVSNELVLDKLGLGVSVSAREYNLTLLTKRDAIEMLSLSCQSREKDSLNPEHWTYRAEGTITITKVANPANPSDTTANDPPTVVTFSEEVKYGVEFKIPLTVDGRNIVLLPDTKYTVKVKLNGEHLRHYSAGSGNFVNDHLTVNVSYDSRYQNYAFPCKKLQYRAVSTGE